MGLGDDKTGGRSVIPLSHVIILNWFVQYPGVESDTYECEMSQTILLPIGQVKDNTFHGGSYV